MNLLKNYAYVKMLLSTKKEICLHSLDIKNQILLYQKLTNKPKIKELSWYFLIDCMYVAIAQKKQHGAKTEFRFSTIWC